MMKFVIIAFCVLCEVHAHPAIQSGYHHPVYTNSIDHMGHAMGYGYHGGSDHHGGYHVAEHKKPYGFGYGIHDPYHGSNFGHQESNDGHVTTGEYYVNLPDGRIQRVSYYADDYGYHPTITYIGEAHHPPAVSYKY